MSPARLSILGSTGSIGRSALEVVAHHPDRLEIAALAARGSDLDLLERQTEEFGPELVAVADETAARELASRLGRRTRVAAGREGLLEAATLDGVDKVLAAVVGAAGLEPVHAALAAGRDVALANKESLVVAGSLLTTLAESTGAEIVPVDSEHAALHQTLRGRHGAEPRRLVLTASGGPFRDREISSWSAITRKEALDHPTWEMGAKISIDSATMMNKGLELIEASHLFDVAPERIDVVVHPQSLVHSLVEFHDGVWMAQMSVNDMTLPIQYALSHPDRWAHHLPSLDPMDLGRLDFAPVDEEKFPTVKLAREALAMGESAPAVLNAANEVAVSAFLAGSLPFTSIVPTVRRVLERHTPEVIRTLDDALAWDAWGRERAAELLGG